MVESRRCWSSSAIKCVPAIRSSNSAHRRWASSRPNAQKAQHEYAFAEKALQRATTLKAEGAVSERDASHADADFKKARADVGRTTAQLKALGITATDPAIRVTIRAQIAGTVVERNVLSGQEVRADQAQPLLTITNLDSVSVVADVYEQDLESVELGASAKVTVPAYSGTSFEGKVIHIADVVDPTSRTLKIRCLVPNPERKLKPEMFAKIGLTATTKKKVIAIPSKAIIDDGDKTKVVVSEGAKLTLRQVQVGPQVEGTVRVFEGLAPGEKIVTEGALFMKREIENL